MTKPLTSNVQWLAYQISHRPITAIIFGLLLCTALTLGMSKLRLETDYQVFFSPDAPEIQHFNDFQQAFGREDTLYFAISTKGQENLLESKHLAIITKFTEQARKLPYVRRVASLANFPLVEADDNDIAIAPGFYLPQQTSNNQQVIDANYPLAQLKARFLIEPSAKYKLLSADAHTTGIFVTMVLPADNRGESALVAHEAAQKLITKMRAQATDLNFYLTGSIALDAAFGEANEFDLSTLFPIAGTVIILLAAFIFRSVILYIALSIVVPGSILACLGFAGWMNIPLSSVSITAPVIVSIIAIAEMIHLFVAWRIQTSDSKEQNVQQAIEKIFVPAFLTTFTTIVGLLSLNFSSAPPFQHLGNIASFGVFMAFIFTFLFLAPLLLLAKKPQAKPSMLMNVMKRWANFCVSTGGRKLAGVVGMVIVVLVLGIGLNKVDDNYVHYFDQSFQFRTDSDYINQELTGIYSLEYRLESQQVDVYQAPYLHALGDFMSWAMQQKGVRSVDSIDDVIKQVNRAFNGGEQQYYLVPQDNDLIRQYATLYEMSVPQDFDFRNRISGNEKSSRFTIFLANLTINEISQLEAAANKFLAGHPYFSQHKENAYSATGTSIIFSKIGLSNINNMLSGTLLLFLLASALMWFIFKRPAIACVATVANIIPAIVTLGIWGYLVGKIGMGSAAVVTVTLGLVIDDTIHLGYRYLALRKQQISAENAIKKAIIEVGPALLVTTFILALGFLVIALSAFEINAALGLMVATTVIVALIFDLLILPLALIKFDRKVITFERTITNEQTI